MFPLVLLFTLLLTPLSQSIKFTLYASHNPEPLCIWNWASSSTLVIVTANVDLSHSPSANAQIYRDKQRLDMEVVDGSGSRNVYQSKRGLKGETRMAITTHEDADLGVCFSNLLDEGELC
jgi:p24 family protein delta-1